MYQFVYYIIFIPVLMYSCYYFVSGLFAFKKYKAYPEVKPKNRFAILIAARNEAEVISGLINSLKGQKYPSDLYDVYVMPNNCTDNTKEVSISHGAKILEFKEKITSKGDVLKLAFNYLNNNEEYDAYVVFDADNVVHEEFLGKMNNALEAGCPVMQGYRDTKNVKDSWISASYALFYWGQNLFFGQSRSLLNSSTNINGTGFVVKKSIVEEFGFNTKTITEDIEYTGLCALNGVRIAFVKEAITYDEQPIDFKTSWKQRKRWSTGTMECCSRYSMKLLKKFFKTGDMFSLDMGLFYMAPHVMLVGAGLSTVLFAYNMIGVKLYDITAYLYALNQWFLILCIMFGMGISILTIKLSNKSVKAALKGVVMFMVFILSWIPINIICLFKKTVVWEEIKHSRSISLDSIKK